jgi:hypothetical protein
MKESWCFMEMEVPGPAAHMQKYRSLYLWMSNIVDFNNSYNTMNTQIRNFAQIPSVAMITFDS